MWKVSGIPSGDSALEQAGFEPVWGFSCQVVVSGLWPVFCSEQESRFSFRRLRSGTPMNKALQREA
jgi:hypothetical protein